MKIAFLFQRDSHFKAVKTTASRVCMQYDCVHTFVGIESEYVPSEYTHSIIYVDVKGLNILHDYDYVIACLGGYLLNQVIVLLKNTNIKVVSIFPGIVSHYQLDAFISRLNADQVWLNSKADFELYSQLCRIFKIKNNGLLYGMSWLDSNGYNQQVIDLNERKKKAIFFEQTELFTNTVSKNNLAKTIRKLIQANPTVLFKYKIRDNSEDQYFVALRSSLNKLRNVEVISDLTDIDIATTTYYLSVSSSALIEGIVYGKKSFIINDSLMDVYSKEFYKKSNLHLRSTELPSSMRIRHEWYEARVAIPKEKVNLKLVKKNECHVDSNLRSKFHIRLKIMRLIISYPKMIYLLLSKNKILRFQKSIEYLSCNKYE